MKRIYFTIKLIKRMKRENMNCRYIHQLDKLNLTLIKWYCEFKGLEYIISDSAGYMEIKYRRGA